MAKGEKQTAKEQNLVSSWIASIVIPEPPQVNSIESKEILKSIQTRFDEMLRYAANKNKLPF